MKQNNFFLKTLLLVVMLAGNCMAWADVTPVSIPQSLGSYVNWSTNATKTAGNGTPESENLVLGSTNGSTTYVIAISNATQQDYLMSFTSGASGLTATVSMTLSDGSSYNVKKDFSVSNTGSWTPTELHAAVFENVPTGSLTLTFKVESTTGSYAGNYGNLAFYTPTECPWPNSSAFNLQYGTYDKAKWNSDGVINYIKAAGASIDNLLAYNSSESFYDFNFNISYIKQNAIVGITITDIATGNIEINNQTLAITANGDKTIHLGSKLTAGWKKIRIDFTDNDIGNEDEHLFNFQTVTIPAATYNALPLMSSTTTYLDLSQWPTSGNPRYQSGDQNLGYIYHGSSAQFYVYNENETAFYNLSAGITTNVSDANLVVTITDLSTGNVEVDNEAFDVATGSSFANQTFKLSGAITPGLKLIHFDFTKDDTSTDPWLYNIKNITFYKRSLNEGYDYTPVAATGVDVVFTRGIKAGNWSTIVLPFDIASGDIATVFGEGTSVAELSSGTENTLNFNTTLTDSKMKANQPYAIKVASDFTSATINGVNIVAGTPTQTVGDWNFVGTYSSTKVPTESYYFKSNQLYQKGASGTTSMKAFRAYLTYTGGAGAPVLNFTIDGETTGIAHISADGRMNLEEGAVYNLAGQRVSQPARGLYIVNGKKYVIK